MSSNLGNVRKSIVNMQSLGIPIVLPGLSPWPLMDNVGFSQALAEIKASQAKGTYHDDYQQYDTIRKMRSSITNLYLASVESAGCTSIMGNNMEGTYTVRCGTQSLFFRMFNQGMRKQMGRDVRPDRALDH